MGIKNFYKFIQTKAPKSIKKAKDLPSLNKDLKFEKIGLDASNVIYKFLTSTLTYSKSKNMINIQKSRTGFKTGHVIGVVYRSLNLLEAGIKPVWVFDGDPVEMKRDELDKRQKNKDMNKEIKRDLVKKGKKN